MNWSPKLVSRQRLLGFSEALICLSYSGMLVPGELWLDVTELVVRRGNAPRSLAYQASALLLSYGTGMMIQAFQERVMTQ